MNELKWYHKVLIALVIVACFPLIIVAIIAAAIYIPIQSAKEKKKYKVSPYYAELGQPFKTGISASPAYRFYNAAKRRELSVQYVRQESNGLEYFIHEETVYVLPDFESLFFDEEATQWQVDLDGDWTPFDEVYTTLLAQLENVSDRPVRLLVERTMIPVFDLNEKIVPDGVFVTWSYETVFENEESPLKMIIPQSTEALYNMMLQTPDLCGSFTLSESKETIVWDLNESIKIEIGFDTEECYFGMSKVLSGKIEKQITHWHPTLLEVYRDVCRIGKCGNVLVLRSSLGNVNFLYAGSKRDCPYSPDKKPLFGKYYYLEAV